jgi:hypothetical protein
LVVQEFPSEHCEASQHSRQSLPQSFGVVTAQRQDAPAQIAPGLQPAPQAPQLVRSLVISTSHPSVALPLQSAKPARQTGVPPEHCWFGPTGESQPPQCRVLERGSMQEPPQRVWFGPQPVTHFVPSQAGVALPQEAPQLPQFEGSLAGVSQPGAVAQSRKPGRQEHPA